MPTISVIVPIYNAESYLAQCIESIIRQTYKDLQIILIDDGSADRSLHIAQDYAQKDTRIELYSQPNQGQSAARNVGLKYATGEWISFIDSDDYIDIDFYQTLMQVIDDKDCVQIGYRRVQNGHIISEHTSRYFYHFTTPWIRIYRRDFLEHNHLCFYEGIIYEDVLFSIDMWSLRPTYKMLNYRGYNYTFNPTSTTSIRNKESEKKIFVLLKKRYKSAQNLTTRLLVCYTYIRLKLHFLKQ